MHRSQLVYLRYSCAQHGGCVWLASLPGVFLLPLASTGVPDSCRARAEGPFPRPGFLVPSGCPMFKADLFSGGCFPESPGSPHCSSWDVADTVPLQLVASVPWFSVGLSTVSLLEPQLPRGRIHTGSSPALWWSSQDGSNVAPPKWSPSVLAATSSFSSLSVRACIGARLASSSENSLGRRANTSTFDPHVGWGSQHSRSSLQKFLHKSSLHPTPEAGVKPQES